MQRSPTDILTTQISRHSTTYTRYRSSGYFAPAETRFDPTPRHYPGSSSQIKIGGPPRHKAKYVRASQAIKKGDGYSGGE